LELAEAAVIVAESASGAGWFEAARPHLSIALPASVTLSWLIAVVATGHLERAIEHWPSAVTMALGSFLAGSSPEGGGAVAFPVFTKVLDVPPSVARTFSLCIQAVGMTAASVVIVLNRRPIERRVVVVATLGGTAGFVFGLLALGNSDTPFWESRLPPAYVKVTFTLVLATMAFVMFAALRAERFGRDRLTEPTGRVWGGVALAAFLGGIIASLTGTGVNAFVFLFVVVVAGLHPRVGVPTSVIAMAAISVAGLVVLGIGDGQLRVVVSEGGEVLSVAGRAVGPPAEGEWDLLGLWLAAVPVVVWGAPLGTWVLHRLQERWLVGFVASLAAVEMVTTAVLVDELRSDRGLLAYGLMGLVGALVAVRWLSARQARVLQAPAAGADTRALSRAGGPESQL
jgi:uncharacterized membrane protein YfcA